MGGLRLMELSFVSFLLLINEKKALQSLLAKLKGFGLIEVIKHLLRQNDAV